MCKETRAATDVLGAQCFADKTMLFATAYNFSNGFSIEMDGNSFSVLLASGSSTILNSCFIVAISGNFHDGILLVGIILLCFVFLFFFFLMMPVNQPAC